MQQYNNSLFRTRYIQNKTRTLFDISLFDTSCFIYINDLYNPRVQLQTSYI